MIINQKVHYDTQSTQNLLFVENNFLIKKRESSSTGNNISTFGSNNKCKYSLSALIYFFKFFVQFYINIFQMHF